MKRFLIALFCTLFIFASSSRNGTTFDSGLGGVISNANEASVEDGVFAVAIGGEDPSQALLRANDFGFSIPLTATIDSLFLAIKSYSTGHDAAGTAITWTLSDFNTVCDANPVGYLFSTSLQWDSVGTSLNWASCAFESGESPIPLWINTSGFGAEITIGFAEQTDTVRIDAVRITIFYTEAVSGVKKRVIGHGNGVTETTTIN